MNSQEKSLPFPSLPMQDFQKGYLTKEIKLPFTMQMSRKSMLFQARLPNRKILSSLANMFSSWCWSLNKFEFCVNILVPLFFVTVWYNFFFIVQGRHYVKEILKFNYNLQFPKIEKKVDWN